MSYVKHVSRKVKPVAQTTKLDKGQVKNNAGGYGYGVDVWDQLERFLILGATGGTYYVGEKKLTRENARVVEACASEDVHETVNRIVNVSDNGRAPKNDAAVFALALIASSANKEDRAVALAALQKVCRIPTHLFQFVGACDELRGWGRGLRTAVGNWYNDLEPEKLAYEVVKYQQRDGWSNRDLLRLSHAAPKRGKAGIFKYIVKGKIAHNGVPDVIRAAEQAKTATPSEVVKLIDTYGLTREMVLSQHLNHAEVWNALLTKMPLNAMVRSLGKMTSVGLSPEGVEYVAGRLTDTEYIKKSRLHPLAVLQAQKVYAQGHGDKGSLSWTPERKITAALDKAFYHAFHNVVPTGKRILLALDVSSSMTSPPIAGTNISPREATAALALVTARTEKDYGIIAFTGGNYRGGRQEVSNVSILNIDPKAMLPDVLKGIDGLPFGGTDCALPMLFAKKRNLKVDAFVVLTDNETWAGTIHPKQALAEYRAAYGPAKLIVVGMTATGFTINDPADADGLDVVGFDTATPAVMSDFIRQGYGNRKVAA